MTSIAIDRNDGLSSSTAIKGPCRVVATSTITLAGLQTIDGVSLAAGDRVLYAVAGVNAGIWIVDTGSWRRAKDFAGSRDVRLGTQIYVTSGTTYSASGWYVNTANPIVVGTTAITISQNVLLNAAQLIALEAAAAVSAAAAAASYASFQRYFLGAAAVAPTVDLAGNALVAGAVYYNTVSGTSFVWDGDSWEATSTSLADASVTAAKITNDSAQQTAIVAKLATALTALFGGSNVINTYTTPGANTWTKPVDAHYRGSFVACWGDGGGGGGSKGDGSGGPGSYFGSGAGGGGGGFGLSWFAAASLGTTETITIGTGGSGGNGATPTNGSAGDGTTFGVLMSIAGGRGGETVLAAANLRSPRPTVAIANPTPGNIIDLKGDMGGSWVPAAGTSVDWLAAGGGAGALGGGSSRARNITVNAAANGDNGNAPGGGGAAGGAHAAQDTLVGNGGTGADGMCIVVDIYAVGAP